MSVMDIVRRVFDEQPEEGRSPWVAMPTEGLEEVFAAVREGLLMPIGNGFRTTAKGEQELGEGKMSKAPEKCARCGTAHAKACVDKWKQDVAYHVEESLRIELPVITLAGEDGARMFKKVELCPKCLTDLNDWLLFPKPKKDVRKKSGAVKAKR